jgi:hypothetical protein
MLNVVMLNVANNPFMLSVVMLNVIMLSVVAPIERHDSEHNDTLINGTHQSDILRNDDQHYYT